MNGARNSTWAVDREASTAEFSIRFLTVAKTVGVFGEVRGEVLFDGADLTSASVEAIIDVPSVDTGNETRDEHIQEREDFFEAGTFPEIRFRSTRVEPGSDGRLSIYGDLTIRDVTDAVVLDARYGGRTTDGSGTRRATFDAETKVSRKDFGVDWGGTASRAVIGDTVSIKIHLEAVERLSPNRP